MPRVSEAVGVGAIEFWCRRSAARARATFVFDWAQATNPSGDTGPYLQYTHARACSIIRKAHAANGPGLTQGRAQLNLLVEKEEVAVCKALEGFPKVIRQSAADYEQSLIATYVLELASAFGDFLNKHRVLDLGGGIEARTIGFGRCSARGVEKRHGVVGHGCAGRNVSRNRSSHFQCLGRLRAGDPGLCPLRGRQTGLS